MDNNINQDNTQFPNIAIVGATGVVGLELMSLFEERDVKFNNLKLLASKESVGKSYCVNDKIYNIEELDENAFDGINFAIFSIDSSLSEIYSPYAVRAGCIVIDNSSAYRLDSNTPLVVPEINPTTITNSGIIANPNCSTIIMLVVLFPLYKKNKIKRIDLTTLQAVSGAGIKAIDELVDQTHSYVNNIPTKPVVFKSQCLFNCFSHDSPIELSTGFNGEEIKIINETKKILHDSSIIINPTCIRVATARSHLESIHIEFENDTTVEELYNTLNDAPGVQVYNDPTNNRFPEPIVSSYKDNVLVGRIRHRYGSNDKKNFLILVSGDQLLKGAALNAVQILELFLNK